jgi:hypothetical protein
MMATIEWLRLWHDMPNDPKWRTISRSSGQSISVVQAVWLQILVSASQSEERGTYTILEEDIASALNEGDDAVAAIIKAMQGRVLDGKRLTGWERRQPCREDGATGAGKSTGSNYVYYVVDTERDVVKVGISRNPWSRVKDIQVGSSSKFELLATLKTTERSEKALHKFFAATRLQGEWFERSEALNSLIQKTISKEVSTFEQSVGYLSSLPVEAFVVGVVGVVGVVTTKDTDTDTDKEREIRASAGAIDPPPPSKQAGEPTPAGEAAKAMRKAGLADTNPSHPTLLALLAAGLSVQELADAAGESVKRGKGFTYALAVAEGRRRDAATVATLPHRQAANAAHGGFDQRNYGTGGKL